MEPLAHYLAEIGQIPRLSDAETRLWAQCLRESVPGSPDWLAARQQLVNANLRLVVDQAKRYTGHGVPLLDLIQEGNLGLLRGIERYDERRGTRVSTYVSWWIKQHLLRALPQQGRSIPLPSHVAEAATRVRRAERALESELGCLPTEEELALALGVPVDELRQLRAVTTPAISLDEPQLQGTLLLRLAAPSGEESPDYTTAEIRGALLSLPPREAMVLRLRFGLLDGRPRTLREVGREFGHSRERIRQLETAAITKLQEALPPVA